MPETVHLVPDASGMRTDVVEMPAAQPAEGQLQVAVTLAGVNFWDIMQRHGRVPLGTPPIPGSEGVGTVTAAGSRGDEHLVGKRVAWSRVPRSYAEFVVGDTGFFHPVPDRVDNPTAAGVLFQGVTAHYLAVDAWPLTAQDVAVVTAAGGGVGLLLTQLLTRRGVEVVAVVSSTAKADAASAAGAQHVLRYGDDIAEQIRQLAPQGVAGVYDSVGGTLPRWLLATLRPRGAMVLYGSASGSEADLGAPDLGAGSYFLTRTAGRDYARTPEEAGERARAVLDAAAEGSLRVSVSDIRPLGEAEAAWDAMESRSSVGKMLLQP